MNKAPVFQHRHYKAIAARIAETEVNDASDVIASFADFFAADNPRFDRARFIAAANGNPSNGRDKVRS